MPILHILNVGHGNSSVLLNEDKITVIDAGPGSDLLEFLLKNRIGTIDYLLLSHTDKDHIGGALNIFASREFVVRNVYINTDSVQDSRIWIDLLCAIQDHNAIKEEVNFEPSLTTNLNGKLNYGEVSVEILAPSPYVAARGPGSTDLKNRRLTSNSISAVIRLSYQGNPIAIFPGDIDEIGLYNLLENSNDIKAKVAVFPHHGGNPGTPNVQPFVSTFCNNVQPNYVIFSIGNNQNNFPRLSVIEAIINSITATTLLSTGHSDVLEGYIQNNHGCSHKNCVGNMLIDFNNNPVQVSY